MQFRFMENDGVTMRGPPPAISEYGLKDGAFVYIQNSAGKWIKVYNNQSAFSDCGQEASAGSDPAGSSRKRATSSRTACLKWPVIRA